MPPRAGRTVRPSHATPWWTPGSDSPLRPQEGTRLYRLKGSLATGEYQGHSYDRYQYKITDGGRLWYLTRAVPRSAKVAGQVLLERCEPGHPKETER